MSGHPPSKPVLRRDVPGDQLVRPAPGSQRLGHDDRGHPVPRRQRTHLLQGREASSYGVGPEAVQQPVVPVAQGKAKVLRLPVVQVGPTLCYDVSHNDISHNSTYWRRCS